MKCLSVALVLFLAVPALAAGPTSRPLTAAQQIVALKAEIEQLKAENEQLRLKLADLEGKIAGGKLVQAEPAEQGATFKPGGLARHARKMGGRINDPKDFKAGEAIAAKADKLIEAYAATHKLPAKAIEGLNDARPAPGMPRELLALLGKFKMESETASSESGKFYLFGLNNNYWNVTVSDGTVHSISGPYDAGYGYAVQGP